MCVCVCVSTNVWCVCRRICAKHHGGFVCVCACVHNMLCNPTHTLFLLHQMNQFLQNFIQHPEGAERRGKHSSLVSSSPTICTAGSPRGPYLPLMLKFFPSIRCLREGCLENAGMTASKSASRPADNTHTSLEYKCNASNITLYRAFVKTYFQVAV